MSRELTVSHIEQGLEPYLEGWGELLRQSDLSPERLRRTVLISVERTPKLLKCSLTSIAMGATTFAVLGLEVDGVTGQGFLLPFADRAQPVIGYKGLNTLADRAGYTISGGIVREGDEFDYSEGSRGFVHHKKLLGADPRRPILAAWAVMSRPGRSDIPSVLDMPTLNAIKAKSPGAKMDDSPWNEPVIGFPAMCEKSAKRRLNRSMPLVPRQFQQAAALDQAWEERGQPAYLRPDGALVQHQATPLLEGQAEEPDVPTGPPSFPIVRFSNGQWTRKRANSLEEWRGLWNGVLERIRTNIPALQQYQEMNVDAFADIGSQAQPVALQLEALIAGKRV